MLLTDTEIKNCLLSGEIRINPRPVLKEALGSCSIDLRLGHSFRVFDLSRNTYIDPFKTGKNFELTREYKIKSGECFMMHPGEFVLATTMEKVILPSDICARLEGRSSMGRLGIVVHSTASLVDPGFIGKIVMELGNLGKMPVALYPGMRICALTFEKLSHPVSVPYGQKKSAKYFGQENPVESRMSQENKI